MIALRDVIVLIALSWPNHVDRAAARAWFEARRQEGWATLDGGMERLASEGQRSFLCVIPV